MVATLRSARLRQAFFLRASWNDPLTLKLITRSTEPPRPLSTCSRTHERDFTCTIYRDGCICSNYGSIPILPVIHCERSSGQYLFDALIDAGDEFGIEVDGFVDPGNRGD